MILRFNIHLEIMNISKQKNYCGFHGVFGYWVVQKNFFLVFLYEKNLGGSYEVAFIPALWMVSSESLKRLYPN